jgi:DNA end-binding protein Ku
MMAYTMRYAEELRNPVDYFRDIKRPEVDDDSLGLAKELIKRKAGHFDPSKFIDGYEVAVKELVEAKLKHAPIPRDEAPAPAKGKVINLMDALRKSVSSDKGSAKDEDEAPAKQTAAAEKKRGLSLVKSAPKKAARHDAKAAKAAPKRKSA